MSDQWSRRVTPRPIGDTKRGGGGFGVFRAAGAPFLYFPIAPAYMSRLAARHGKQQGERDGGP